MNIAEIQADLALHHAQFLDYIATLSADEFVHSHDGKWTPGQQLAHIVKCVKPLVQVYSMEQSEIEKLFGNTDRPGRSYTELLTAYKHQLAQGGKAPSQYVPDAVSPENRTELAAKLEKYVGLLSENLRRFSEGELDKLMIPHPLLGLISLREMLFNAIYHVQHHHQLTKEHLKASANQS